MTISNTSTTVVYTGNDSTLEFDFTFPLTSESDLKVKLFTIATEVEEILLTSQYTVVFTRSEGKITGGTVTYPKGVSPTPLSTTHKIILEREVPYTQPTTISNQSGFKPDVIESALDRLTLLVQQVRNELSRTFVLSAGSSISTLSDLYQALLNSTASAANNAAAAEAAKDAAETAEANTVAALSGFETDLATLESSVSSLNANALLDSDVGTDANDIVALDSNGRLPAVDGSQLLNVGGALTLFPYVFTANGTLTFPNGGKVVAYVWGAGAGGGRGATGGYAQGGGGGALAIKTVQMDSGEEITITVGTGGLGAALGSGVLAGSPGGASSIASAAFATVTANGGLGGQAAVSSLPVQARATATGGDVNLGGGRGGAVTAVRGGSGGGGAAGIGEGRDSGDVTVASGASGGAGLAGNSANNSLVGGAAPEVITTLFGLLDVSLAAGGAGSTSGAASNGGPFSGGGGSGLGLSASQSNAGDGGLPGGGGGGGANSGAASGGDGANGLVIILTDTPAIQS